MRLSPEKSLVGVALFVSGKETVLGEGKTVALLFTKLIIFRNFGYSSKM